MEHLKMPPAMILCGGKGTRLRDVTELLPKPMVPVGEQPIVWHIMKSYAAFGVNRFILCLGYKREAFVDYFINYRSRVADCTLKLGNNPDVRFHGDEGEADWEVTLAGTGLESLTGTRVARAAKYLAPDDRDFFLTYGDGLCDVDLGALLEHHRAGGKALTITAVHPEARFGELQLTGDEVRVFTEKPAQVEGYINGGYMVVDRGFVGRYLDADDETLAFERRPMARAAEDGELGAFRHDGFWQCMDNPREYALLNTMWSSGRAPWTRHWKAETDVQ